MKVVTAFTSTTSTALFRAHRHQQIHRSNAGRTGTQTDDFRRLQCLALHVQGVDQPGADDDGGAVLIIVEYRDVETFAQRRFYFKAVWRGYVFEVDAAEGGSDGLDHLDEFLRCR